MTVQANSRHNHSAIISVVNSAGGQEEQDHLGIRPRVQLTVSADNFEYTPSISDNWSRISWKLLGDGRFYWVIADQSNIVNPWTDLLPKMREVPVTRLGADLSVGQATTLTVARPERVDRGNVYKVEDMDPDNPVSYTFGVQEVDQATGILTITSTNVTTAIPAALSRVSRVMRDDVTLTVPTADRVLFQAYDFANSLVTLVE